MLIILIVSSLFGSKGNYGTQKTTASLIAGGGTIGELIRFDSNNNGIPDWQESLYGLDPAGDGAKNKKIIEQKMTENGIDISKTEQSDSPATATDTFTKSLLSTILAMRQSGTLTTEAITNLAQTVDKNVDTKHAVAPSYTIVNIHVTTTPQAKETYATALKKIIDKYSDLDIGTEMSIIASGMADGHQDELKQLGPIANAYTDISNKMVALPTPKDAVEDALNLINATAQMGVALEQVETLPTDAITGMVGIDDYLKASKISDQASDNLNNYFNS